ncbi:MAG: hypothetical protein CMH52_09795 [Myxococcales bacterium]|nr:hypothetical protein [Myxococcales bacterium]
MSEATRAVFQTSRRALKYATWKTMIAMDISMSASKTLVGLVERFQLKHAMDSTMIVTDVWTKTIAVRMV